MQNRWTVFLTVSWLAASLAGCASTGLFKSSKNDFPKAGPKHPVTHLVGVWQPAMGPFENRTMRGFTGQVLFFSEGSDQPVQVDGDVRIYVFDDQGSPEQQVVPIHELTITAAEWSSLLSRGPLGATYNIFIPYIRPGNHEAKCALRIRYIPKGGGPAAYSDMVNICLEGKKKAVPADSPAKDDDTAVTGQGDSARSANSESNQVALRNTAPARQLAETISVPDEARPPRAPRRAAGDLTDEDRARLKRQAHERVKAEMGHDVVLVDRDGLPADRAPIPKQSSARPVADPSDDAAESDDWEEDGDEIGNDPQRGQFR